MIFVIPSDVLICLLPISTQYFVLLLTTYGNASLLTLFENLQKSTTKYDDESDVDEFDYEAAPPVKNIIVPRRFFLSFFLLSFFLFFEMKK